MSTHEIIKYLEGKGFESIVCNWADALMNNADNGMDIELVSILNHGGLIVHRLFCASTDLIFEKPPLGSFMKYYHSIVTCPKDIDEFLVNCGGLSDTHD